MVHGDEFAGRGAGPVFNASDGVAIWVEAERKRQDRKWGGWEHDSLHTPEEWRNILKERLDKLAAAQEADNFNEVRRRAIELTAVGFAYLEQIYEQNMQNLTSNLQPPRDR